MNECGAWTGVALILGTAAAVTVILVVVTVAWAFHASRKT